MVHRLLPKMLRPEAQAQVSFRHEPANHKGLTNVWLTLQETCTNTERGTWALQGAA